MFYPPHHHTKPHPTPSQIQKKTWKTKDVRRKAIEIGLVNICSTSRARHLVTNWMPYFYTKNEYNKYGVGTQLGRSLYEVRTKLLQSWDEIGTELVRS